MTSVPAHQYMGFPDMLVAALQTMGVQAKFRWSSSTDANKCAPVEVLTDAGVLEVDVGDWVAVYRGDLVVLEPEGVVRAEEVTVHDGPKSVQ